MTPLFPNPQHVATEMAEFNAKLLRGSALLRSVRDADVQIGTTPKQDVWRQDKTTLYRYEPMAKRSIKRSRFRAKVARSML